MNSKILKIDEKHIGKSKIIASVYWLCSRIPFFSITVDEWFDEIPYEAYINSKLDEVEKRISLVSFGWGIRKIYLLTKKGKKINVLKVITMQELGNRPSETETSSKSKEYYESLSDKSSEEINIEVDFLKYKINQNESTKNVAFDKMNMYIAVTIVLGPLLFTGWANLNQYYNRILLNIIAAIILYNFINIVLIILDFIKVKSFYREGFRELKKADDHLRYSAKAYYYEWFAIKEEAPFFVSYVRNIQRYITYLIVYMTIFLLLSYGLPLFDKLNSKQNTQIMEQHNTSIDITVDHKRELNEKDIINLTKVQEMLRNKRVERIIIIWNDSEEPVFLDKLDKIISVIDLYNINQLEIHKVKLYNESSLKENYIKLLFCIKEER